MKSISLIQYLPLSHPRASMRVVKQLSDKGVMSILDLEDSLQDPFNFNQTRILKKNAKENLINFIKKKKWNINDFKKPIYIRVNATNTEFFIDDINFVIEIFSYGFPVTGIFLPMVETYDQISNTKMLLDKNKDKVDKINILEIVPMIETLKGKACLEKLLQEDRNLKNFSKIHYGHFDYCLDAKLWPYPDPNHYSFWHLVKPIVDLTYIYNKTYIHTPFPFPNNPDLFWSSSRYLLESYPNSNIWICTLNSELSLSVEPQNLTSLKLFSQEESKRLKIKEAKNITKNFLAGRANKRSFGISQNRFIPPHQYQSAQQFLAKYKIK